VELRPGEGFAACAPRSAWSAPPPCERFVCASLARLSVSPDESVSGAQGACESNGSLSPIDENLIFANFLRMHVELRKAPFWWILSRRALEGNRACPVCYSRTPVRPFQPGVREGPSPTAYRPLDPAPDVPQGIMS